MNDEKIYNFKPLEIREGYRKDGMLFAKCSECSEHISFTNWVKDIDGNDVSGRVWSHNLYSSLEWDESGHIRSQSYQSVDYCPMALIKEQEVIIVSKLTDAYKLVIEDILSDIGYVKGAKETTIAVLNGRLYELVEIWGHSENESENSAV